MRHLPSVPQVFGFIWKIHFLFKGLCKQIHCQFIIVRTGRLIDQLTFFVNQQFELFGRSKVT